MNSKSIVEGTGSNWKTQTLVVGTIIGAVIGASAAYILIQQTEKKGTDLSITPNQGMKLGLSVINVLRQVSSL